jgi:hypothetical protein
MDNPSQEPSNTPLNVNSAVQAFGAFLEAPEIKEKSAQDLEQEALQELTAKTAVEPEKTEAEAEPEEEGAVTIEVDGKTVTLTKEQLADAYKNGLRQSDYTKKTMEAAEQRKAADAELQKARTERNAYQQNLQKNAVQLEAVLQQQQSINWEQLLNTDPVEYMRQQHLLNQRQAAYQQTIQQYQKIEQMNQAEQQQQMEAYLHTQQAELLAKLPEWKDPAKATPEKEAIVKYLVDQGFPAAALDNISDHKTVILARKAMLYDKMMEKAGAAAKKIATVPTKIVKPGVGESPNNLDKRSQAFQRLGKTGRIEDAAALFSDYV